MPERPVLEIHLLRRESPMRRIVALTVFTIAGCTGSGQPLHTAAVPRGPAYAVDVAEIQAVRAASNAAIARRDPAGIVANMMPTYSGLWAGAVTQAPRDSAFESFRRQFDDTTRLGYVRTPISIDVSAIGPTAAEYGRWVGPRRRADGIQETSGTYYAVWLRTPEGWRLNAETFVALSCTGSASCPVRQ